MAWLTNWKASIRNLHFYLFKIKKIKRKKQEKWNENRKKNNETNVWKTILTILIALVTTFIQYVTISNVWKSIHVRYFRSNIYFIFFYYFFIYFLLITISHLRWICMFRILDTSIKTKTKNIYSEVRTMRNVKMRLWRTQWCST